MQNEADDNPSGPAAAIARGRAHCVGAAPDSCIAEASGPIFGPRVFWKSGTDAVDGIRRHVRAGPGGRARSRHPVERGSAAPPIEDPVKARLVAETGSIAPGETVWVALHLEMRPGWHVYWRNPGDAGLPPEIAWTLPPGFTAGEIAWPTPERFVVDEHRQLRLRGLGRSAGSDHRADPKSVRPAAGRHRADRGARDLARLLRYLHSGRARSWRSPCLSPPRLPAPTRRRRALFAAARERLPQPAGFATTRCRVRHGSDAARSPPRRSPEFPNPTVSFFPTEPNLIDAAAEPRTAGCPPTGSTCC